MDQNMNTTFTTDRHTAADLNFSIVNKEVTQETEGEFRPVTRPESKPETRPESRPETRAEMSGSRILLVLLLVLQISEPKIVRLEGGATRCEGKLAVKRLGLDWLGVDPRNSDLKFANRVCLELNCGSAVSVRRQRVTRKTQWMISHNCEETSLNKCFTYRLSSTSELYLKCLDSVRLRGPSLCSGSLELLWDLSWTPVCEEGFDLQDAEVVCRELGCGAPSLLQGALYGEGQALGQTFQCEGHEFALMDCPRSSPGNTCSSGAAVNLTCSEPVRLVGGASRCAGTVELSLRGEWRPVEVFGPWDLEATAAVCRDLDCGSAVSGEIRNDFPERPLWRVTADCVKKSALRDCVWGRDYTYTSAVDVVCSENRFGAESDNSEKEENLLQTRLGSQINRGLEDPQRTGPEDPQRTGPEDPQRTGPEDPQRTGPEDPQRTGSEIQMNENLSPDPRPVEST